MWTPNKHKDARKETRAVRKKRRFWKRAKNGMEEMAKYKEAEKETARRTRAAKRAFEKRLAHEKHTTAGHFTPTKIKTKNRAAIGPLWDGQRSLVTEDEAKSAILNTVFESVFTDEGDRCGSGR
jgi:hypothetical protein